MDRIHYNLTQFQNLSGGIALLATDDYSSTPYHFAVGQAKWTIFIQRITLGITTDNAATLSFQDTAGTPVVAAKSRASPGLGPISWDFGQEGFPLTEGKGLDIKNSAAGLACSITIQAYRRLTSANVANVPGTQGSL